MEDRHSASWGAVAVRGCLALAFAVVTLSWPRLSLAILLLPFAVYAIGDGIFTLLSIGYRARRPWATAIEGVLSLCAGFFVLFAPATATKTAVIFIGLWALFTGVMELLEAPPVEGTAFMAVSGILRVFLGILLVARPHLGMMTLIGFLAVYAFAEAIVLFGLAYRLRREGPPPLRHQTV